MRLVCAGCSEAFPQQVAWFDFDFLIHRVRKKSYDYEDPYEKFETSYILG